MPSIVLDRTLGAIETVSPSAIPDGFAQSAVNVELTPHAFVKPRAGHDAFTAPTGATGEVRNLYTERISGTEVLWAFAEDSGTLKAYRYASGSWTAHALPDTPAFGTAPDPSVVACAYNGKVFLAYNSVANRLHVWDGTSVRRVGVVRPSAPTVADTGSGSYGATLRYYKIQFVIRDAGGVTIASSELSASQSFTPSGSGAAARVTKSGTPDNATHWRVYGSTDNITFYEVSGVVAVGTSTYDDVTAPSAYSGGTIAPEAGLFIPPPSCKYLATNGERLFMAGAYETSGSSSETAPNPRRIWFTRPLGVTDRGDDEAVTHLTGSYYWLDLDTEDGGPITSLVSTLDGAIYAGTATSLWRLSDTSLTDKPIQAERVVAGVGPISHTLLTVSDTVDGAMVYFGAPDGPYRYSPSTGVQYLGEDWVKRGSTPAANINYFQMVACAWDPMSRRVVWLYNDIPAAPTLVGSMRWLDPSLIRMVDGVWRGGWTRDAIGIAHLTLLCATTYDRRLMLGGSATDDATPILLTRDENSGDDAGTAFTPTLHSKEFIMDDGTRNFHLDEPYLFKGTSLAVALTANRHYASATVSDVAAVVALPSTDMHRIKVEGLELADCASFSISLNVTAFAANADTRHVGVLERMVIPYAMAERG